MKQALGQARELVKQALGQARELLQCRQAAMLGLLKRS